MLTHGWRKVQMVWAGDFDKFGDPLGIGSGLSLILVMFAEFVCAILVMLGLATRFAAVPIVIAMCVAAFVVHANDPWTMAGGSPSKQPALMYGIVFLSLALTGAGKLSLDALICGKGCGVKGSK